jgi:hypothetical protein
MKTKVVAVAVILGAIFNSADAQIKQHAKNQQHRIAQGVRSGELTKRETKNLVADQKNIRREVRSAKADGNVTRAERRDIRRDQRQAKRKIHRKKHNNRDRN